MYSEPRALPVGIYTLVLRYIEENLTEVKYFFPRLMNGNINLIKKNYEARAENLRQKASRRQKKRESGSEFLQATLADLTEEEAVLLANLRGKPNPQQKQLSKSGLVRYSQKEVQAMKRAVDEFACKMGVALRKKRRDKTAEPDQFQSYDHLPGGRGPKLVHRLD